MKRLDDYPTHELNGIRYRCGRVKPFGASLIGDGTVNFSVFSKYAESCELLLYNIGEPEPFAVLPFPDDFRIGNVFAMIVYGLDYEELEYGYRFSGPYAPEQGHRFDSGRVLLDPYAKLVGGGEKWGAEPSADETFRHRGRVIPEDYDWDGDKPLEIPMKDLVIYEMHIRSFTRDESSGVKHKGTFAGVIEKIPYLKELGVNCVELLPIFEFDELENSRVIDGERLYNYWGYSTVNFFAPKAGYAAASAFGLTAEELKNMVKKLHKAGIEVMLDVVFNHTAEGNENGPYISYRGIDNKTYYLLTPEGYYYNFSGCGNTMNCNNAVVRSFILVSYSTVCATGSRTTTSTASASTLRRYSPATAAERLWRARLCSSSSRTTPSSARPSSLPRHGTRADCIRWAASPRGDAGLSGTADTATAYAALSRAERSADPS